MSPTKILIGQGCLVVSIVAGGLWASTQWTAAMLGNQPRLGAPLTTILGQPIYAPWRLFEWWYAYEAYAPAVFRKAGMFAAGSGIAGTLVAIAGSLLSMAETNCARRRRKSVPVWLIKKGGDALGLVCTV